MQHAFAREAISYLESIMIKDTGRHQIHASIARFADIDAKLQIKIEHVNPAR